MVRPLTQSPAEALAEALALIVMGFRPSLRRPLVAEGEAPADLCPGNHGGKHARTPFGIHIDRPQLDRPQRGTIPIVKENTPKTKTKTKTKTKKGRDDEPG
jgi:hypothetical protein